MRPGLSAPLLPQTSASRGRGSSIAPRFWPLVIFGPSLVHRWSSPSAHGPRLWASDIILGLVHVSQVAGNLRAIRLAGCVAACYNKWITKQNVIVSTKKKSATSFTQSPIESQATLSMALWIGGCTVLGVLGLAGAGGGSGISTGALAVFQRLSK